MLKVINTPLAARPSTSSSLHYTASHLNSFGFMCIQPQILVSYILPYSYHQLLHPPPQPVLINFTRYLTTFTCCIFPIGLSNHPNFSFPRSHPLSLASTLTFPQLTLLFQVSQFTLGLLVILMVGGA